MRKTRSAPGPTPPPPDPAAPAADEEPEPPGTAGEPGDDDATAGSRCCAIPECRERLSAARSDGATRADRADGSVVAAGIDPNCANGATLLETDGIIGASIAEMNGGLPGRSTQAAAGGVTVQSTGAVP